MPHSVVCLEVVVLVFGYCCKISSETNYSVWQTKQRRCWSEL